MKKPLKANFFNESKNLLIEEAYKLLNIENDVRKKLEELSKYDIFKKGENFKLYLAFNATQDNEEFYDFCEVEYEKFEEFLEDNAIVWDYITRRYKGSSLHHLSMDAYSGENFIFYSDRKDPINEYIKEKFRDKVGYYTLLEMIENGIDFDLRPYQKGFNDRSGILGYYNIDCEDAIIETWQDILDEYETEKYIFDENIDKMLLVAKYLQDFKDNQVKLLNEFSRD